MKTPSSHPFTISSMAAAVLAISVGLAGCNDDGHNGSQSSAKQAKAASPANDPDSAISASLTKLEAKSPDQAVKAWWKIVDATKVLVYQDCLKRAKSRPASMNEAVEKIATGRVRLAYDNQSTGCSVDTFSRDIQEVKTESETRAVVFTLIKNTTPIPDGAEPSDLQKKWRNEGERFKYLLEKSGGNWKVSQVYQYSETARILGKDDLWEKQFDDDSDKPRFPALVGQQ